MKAEDPERAKQAVGRRIAEIRSALGLTQAALAAKLGDNEDARPSPQYVGLVEQGRENLTIKSLVGFANALGVPLRSLFDPPQSLTKRRGRPPQSSPTMSGSPAKKKGGPRTR